MTCYFYDKQRFEGGKPFCRITESTDPPCNGEGGVFVGTNANYKCNATRDQIAMELNSICHSRMVASNTIAHLEHKHEREIRDILSRVNYIEHAMDILGKSNTRLKIANGAKVLFGENNANL